jgi:hypothetical protein
MEAWTPAGDRRGIRVHAHPQAARGVSRSHPRVERVGAQETPTRWAMARATMPARRRAISPACIPQKTAGADIKNGVSGRQIARPHIGTAAFSVARTGVRRLTDRRQLRFRLLLRVHQQPLVAQRDGAECRRRPIPASSSSGSSARSTRRLDPRHAPGGSDSRRSVLDLVTAAYRELVKRSRPADRARWTSTCRRFARSSGGSRWPSRT